ncbi:hypothetical protein [Streptosporangium sp. NPDC001681]|uniref:hypothetical protein n=1 Tax=Streptosporangium sp. NPDC001681 TaxID=3154395 RepID=UPI003328740C
MTWQAFAGHHGDGREPSFGDNRLLGQLADTSGDGRFGLRRRDRLRVVGEGRAGLLAGIDQVLFTPVADRLAG